jgi:hypothetical protein
MCGVDRRRAFSEHDTQFWYSSPCARYEGMCGRGVQLHSLLNIGTRWYSHKIHPPDASPPVERPPVLTELDVWRAPQPVLPGIERFLRLTVCSLVNHIDYKTPAPNTRILKAYFQKHACIHSDKNCDIYGKTCMVQTCSVACMQVL